MPAVTVIGKKIKLSFSYDAITLYPQDDAGDDIHDRCRDAQIQIVSILFGVPAQVAKMIINSQQNTPLNTCLSKMQKNSRYDRPVHRDDADHALYHMDNINMDEDHYHVKYKQPFKKVQLELTLSQLKADDLITDDEYQAFFDAYDSRQSKAFGWLAETMTGNVEDDTRDIVRCIAKIQDNDVLAVLHDYLLEDKRFSHIMKQKTCQYRGTTVEDDVIDVSKEWADIEKAISLQMVANLRAKTTMESNMRMERAQQFQACHAFFGIKRKTKHSASQTNNVVLKLVNGDAQRLDAAYKKHMGKF